MPRPSVFDQFNEAEFKAFEQEFIARNFKGLDAMVDWLAGRGFEVSRGAVHRAGAKIKRRLQCVKDATLAAKLVVESVKDDEGSLSEAVISLVQSEMFEVMTSLQEMDADTDPAERLKMLGNAARAAADIGRASISQKKWRMDMQAKAASAAEKVSQLAKKGGLSADAVDAIRREILGIAA